MDVAARNKLAELMYEVKDKVPDGTFLEFMNILARKENKPDFKDVQFVKLTYFHHQYLEPYRLFDDSECMGYDMSFKAHRIDRTLRTQILELTDEYRGTMGMDLFHSRMFYKKFDTIAEGIHNTCDINNVSAGRKSMFMLCDDEWITPIKYERDILNFPFCLFSGATTRARILLGARQGRSVKPHRIG